MNRKMIKSQDGITLLEVMVAMIIMSFSLLLLLNMTMVALDGNTWSENTTVTTQLLQEKLEQLRSVRNTNLQSGSDTAQGYGSGLCSYLGCLQCRQPSPTNRPGD